MTPKEKAEDLVFKYDFLQAVIEGFSFYDAKQCALIAVDEMLEEYQSMSDLESKIVINNKPTFVVHQLIYWREVKQEIEKL